MITQDEMIESVKINYGLVIVGVEVINRLMFRQSFLLTTNNAIQYIVKDYADIFSLHELSQIWKYYWDLRSFHIRVGCPLKKLGSSEYHMHLNNRYYVVYEYVTGRCPGTNQFKEIALCLKRYHGIAADSLLPGLASTEDKLTEARGLLSYFNQGVYSLKEEIISCKTKAYSVIDRYYNSNQTIIHGDSILENIISENGESCLIDFDNIRRGDAAEDLANTILSFLYYGSKEYKIRSGRSSQINALIYNYYGYTVSTDIEEMLHYYMLVHCVIELARHAENIRFLVRMPSMKPYLLLLVRILHSNSLNELI